MKLKNVSLALGRDSDPAKERHGAAVAPALEAGCRGSCPALNKLENMPRPNNFYVGLTP